MEEINAEKLREKCRQFKEVEGRASFFDLAMEIATKYPLQASILILATWNIGRFRFVLKDNQNFVDLSDAIEKCKPLFEKIRDKNFKNVDFNEIGSIVEEIYITFSRVKGVEYTGASKLIHLFAPNLFVMWDSYMRKKYGCQQDATGYLKFQKLMQEKFAGVKWNEAGKTLPKAIDEYNYVTITLPELRRKRPSFQVVPDFK